ncbi:uncharacterized protein LOC127849914 [Dreissena polymorpha]|uniref:uncharacterized protein LOC127849914 n=1 Tax=Dreissena polymorpha TaxID=45954 RepID=UPI002263FCFC|nr:uncharacterized protein LOC127849914 [Dreissena polymorpha]
MTHCILKSTLSSFNAIGFRVTQVHKLHKAMEYDDDNEYTDIDATLNSVKHERRIVLLVIDQFNLRNVMLQANKLNMTNGEYQFLYTYGRIATQHILETNFGKDRLWRRGDENDAFARQAVENMLLNDTRPEADNESLPILKPEVGE